MAGDQRHEHDPLQGEGFSSGEIHPYAQEPGPLVRPYAITGGRTYPRHELAIEALVSTSLAERNFVGYPPEVQAICELCRAVRSVAEVSALLRMPLGVARVLIADLANDGMVFVHRTPAHEDGQPDLAVLERVLSGLHRL